MSYLLEVRYRGGANTTHKHDTDEQVEQRLKELMDADGPIEVRIYKAQRTVRRRDIWDEVTP